MRPYTVSLSGAQLGFELSAVITTRLLLKCSRPEVTPPSLSKGSAGIGEFPSLFFFLNIFLARYQMLADYNIYNLLTTTTDNAICDFVTWHTCNLILNCIIFMYT